MGRSKKVSSIKSDISIETRELIKILETILTCLKKLTVAIDKFIQRNKLKANHEKETDFLVKEKLKILDEIFEQYNRLRKNMDTNVELLSSEEKLKHPELFFSCKELQKLKIHHLIYRGKYQLIQHFNFSEKVFTVSRKINPLKIYAMKVTSIRNSGIKQEAQVGKFGRDCHFLVETKGTFGSKEYLFCIMDFVNGGSLAFHLDKKKRFDEVQIKFYSAQIICGLLFLHSNGFIYENLKLENVLLDSNGNCKICDFEDCTNYKEEEKIKYNMTDGAVTTSGKYQILEYEPPEIYTNNSHIEYSADYWALGISMYKMFTGNFPFLNRESIINGEIPEIINIEISKEAIDIIKSLLNKNLFERLGSRKNPKKIKQDLFFQEIDWIAIENLEIKPPFKPNVESPFDASNFDSKLPYKSWDGMELELKNFQEYIENDFEIINHSVAPNINLIRHVDTGGFGTVHLAKVSNTFYALKTIKWYYYHQNSNDNRELADSLINEKKVGILARESRFLVHLITSFQSHEYIFLFMEFLSGDSLCSYFQILGVFPEEYVQFYSAQILCGISFLHSKNYVHRDLKLDNCILDSNGNAKICDFGLCCELAPNDKLDFICGGEEYYAPEMLLGSYNHSVDYWSLGINAFSLFVGNYPFSSHENEGVGLTIEKSIVNDPLPDLNKTRKKEHPQMKEISEAGCDFVRKLLNKNPDERLGSITNPENIKKHDFFRKINWIQLENGKLEPPIKPNIDIMHIGGPPNQESIGVFYWGNSTGIRKQYLINPDKFFVESDYSINENNLF